MAEIPPTLYWPDAPAATASAVRRLFGASAADLAVEMQRLKEPAFRVRQITEAIYRQWVDEIDQMTTLPLTLRRKLTEEGWTVGRPTIDQVFESKDGTERYLVSTPGLAETVEAVWMPEGDGGEAGDGTDEDESRDWQRATICVSSQVGCAVNCQFCLTARLGLQRNLGAGEIAGQIVSILKRHAVELGRDRINIVFMGMGEPFLNYEAWSAALRLLVEEVGLSPQRMTVSTSGIVPAIERFATEPMAVRPKLAISLNAPNDTIRAEVMPINRKWPIEAIVDAVRRIDLRPKERITFEYVLLGGVTDQPEHAREVARLLKRMNLPVKLNLIAWNPGPGVAFAQPAAGAVEAFRASVARAGIPVYLRRPRGQDIYAACGQLKRTVETGVSSQ